MKTSDTISPMQFRGPSPLSVPIAFLKMQEAIDRQLIAALGIPRALAAANSSSNFSSARTDASMISSRGSLDPVPPPLQTHGLCDEEWIPPRSLSRFISFGREDEHWLRPLGLGTVRRIPKPLYDVRDEFGELMGFSPHDPTRCHRSLRVACFDGDLSFAFRPTGRLKIAYLRIDTAVYARGGERFTSWKSRAEDAIGLLQCGFITTAGQDMIAGSSARIG